MTGAESSGTAHRGLPHVAVIGGGVIGLSTAWRLAQRGCTVTLFDAGGNSDGGASEAASWASAGLLAPGVEAEPTEESLHALSERSLAMWPAFAEELEAASGVALDFRSSGSLVVALTRDDVLRLEHSYAFHEQIGTRQRWVSRQSIGDFEANLAGTVLAARHLPNDRQVDPRALLVALRKLLLAQGVTMHATRVERLELGGAQPLLVGEGWERTVDMVVLAAGARSAELAGIPLEWRPPVRPVKGQMLAVEAPSAAALLQHAVFTPRVYMVPRTSGRLLVGATVEDRGFEDGVTAGGLLHLLEASWRALPAIESARVVESWCGFRPGSPDDAPLLGFRDRALVYATGHYRNGILLAPVTADAIAETICTGQTPAWILPYSPSRFDEQHV